MAEHAQNPHHAANGMDAHKAAYQGFLDFSVAGSIICIYIVVALVTFRFVSNPANVVVGFGGILIGVITSLIALRMGGKWLVAVVPLVLFALYVAGNVNMS
jgi:Bacterial aa3 type cytochrome c oxidase subunit IV